MDIEKLIERLKKDTDCWTDKVHGYADLRIKAATALSTLQNELTHKTELVRQQSNELERRDKLLKEQEAELEQVEQERAFIEQDFRAFAKQWWEEDSGFPCLWCKFEKSGDCEWKVKNPSEEKICAGRAFEWRGPKEG